MIGRFSVSRPRLLLRLGALVVLAATLSSIALMLATPIANIDAEMGNSGTIDLIAEGRRLTLPGAAEVSFHNATTGQQLTLPATLLPGVSEPRGTRIENAEYWAQRDRLSSWLQDGPVEVSSAGQHWRAIARPRLLADLTIGFWLSLLAGAAAGLAGLWVWVLRPTVWAPILFCTSGVGLFIGCATTAINVSHGLVLSGTIDRALMIVNYYSGVLCAGSLAALFARFPAPILGPRSLWPLAAINLAAGATVQFDLVSNAVDVAIGTVMADSLMFIALLIVQGWLIRHNSEGRAQLLPIAIGAVVPTVLFCLLSLAGQLAGGTALVQPDWTAPLLLMIYLGLGISVARAGLFTLGRRSLTLLLSAATIILFILIEAIVLAHVTRQRDLALLIAAILVSIVYLPTREWALRRVERQRYDQAGDLLQHAGNVALAPSAEAARLAWREAAAAIFKPLEVAPVPVSRDAAQIAEGGHSLYLPGPDSGSTLLLRWPEGGGRIFDGRDLAIADRFVQLVRRLVDGRDSYMRGVVEERQRIARDLHDDVSARLLTSLHRTDTVAMHADVRDAMTDIRTIVTGLSGEAQPLDRLLAGLRHETHTRLAAAGIAMVWPLETAARDDADGVRLDYRSYRHLLSIVRECISNVIRHSKATCARVTVEKTGQLLMIQIEDDGIGIPKTYTPGHGLANAARRAKTIGGTFGLTEVAGWTRAVIALPLTAASESATI